jgi:glycosyltransferase involved in cell wall biosynthesis
MAPVFSNLPPPRQLPRHAAAGHVVGVFGYAYQSAAASLVLEAVQRLSRQGSQLRLALLGAPGRASHAAEELLLAARAGHVEDLVSFAGPLPAQELSDALAACDVLVFCDRGGPSSRKGTLAGALASGAPVVAIDGPRRWSELLSAGALELVEPSAPALAGALEALLADEERRHALGARGREFAEQRMGVEQTVDAVMTLLDQLARPSPAGAAGR